MNRSELSPVVRNLDEHLALVLAREEADEGVDALLETVRVRLTQLKTAVADVAGHLLSGDVVAVGVVEDDELQERRVSRGGRIGEKGKLTPSILARCEMRLR